MTDDEIELVVRSLWDRHQMTEHCVFLHVVAPDCGTHSWITVVTYEHDERYRAPLAAFLERLAEVFPERPWQATVCGEVDNMWSSNASAELIEEQA